MSTVSRRTTMTALAALAGGFALGGCGSAPGPARAGVPAERQGPPAVMPDEGEPHERTLLSWPAPTGPWGPDLSAVREDIAALATALVAFEPVLLLATPDDVVGAQRACGTEVEVIDLAVDDLWIRDTGPTFVRTPDGLAGVDTRFNGWGGKQAHDRDALVARRLLERLGVPRIEAPLITEGGAIEVDGHGTLLTTESSLLNDNRNPGRSRDDLERDLQATFGVDRVIWLPGVRGADITDGHIDGIARFAGPDVVVVHRPAPDDDPDELAQYRATRSLLAEQGSWEIVDLPAPRWSAIGDRGRDFLAAYINYYVANGAVLAPAFGDRSADATATEVLGELYPGREVVQVPIDTLAEGGGGIHCATQQQPRS